MVDDVAGLGEPAPDVGRRRRIVLDQENPHPVTSTPEHTKP
jgi:hypothetical protein